MLSRARHLQELVPEVLCGQHRQSKVPCRGGCSHTSEVWMLLRQLLMLSLCARTQPCTPTASPAPGSPKPWGFVGFWGVFGFFFHLHAVPGSWRTTEPPVLLSCPYNLKNLTLSEENKNIWMFYCYCKAVTFSPPTL